MQCHRLGVGPVENVSASLCSEISVRLTRDYLDRPRDEHTDNRTHELRQLLLRRPEHPGRSVLNTSVKRLVVRTIEGDVHAIYDLTDRHQQ